VLNLSHIEDWHGEPDTKTFAGREDGLSSRTRPHNPVWLMPCSEGARSVEPIFQARRVDDAKVWAAASIMDLRFRDAAGTSVSRSITFPYMDGELTVLCHALVNRLSHEQ